MSPARETRVIRRTVAFLLLVPLAAAGVLSAHEGRRVGADGQYTLVVGWRNEPAYAGEPNAVDIFVSRTEDRRPLNTSKGDVVDLEVEIQLRADDAFEAAVVEAASFDDAPSLAPMTENRYNSWLQPARPGAYAFRVRGVIEDAGDPQAGRVTVDETFVCGGGSKGEHAYVCVTTPQVFPSAGAGSHGDAGPSAGSDAHEGAGETSHEGHH